MATVTDSRFFRARRSIAALIAVFSLLSGLLVLFSAPAAAFSGPVTLRPIDGGADYFAQWSNSLPVDQDFYPLAVWAESLDNPASDAAKYRDLGINGFIYLWNGMNPAIESALVANDQWTFTSPPAAGVPGPASPYAGYQWFDEPEIQDVCPIITPMWVKSLCTSTPYETPASAVQTMSDAIRAFDPSRPTYGQYTKHLPLADILDDHTRHAYVDAVDVVSFDWYTMTDRVNTAPQWQQADAVKSVRALTNYEKPVWAFIETSELFDTAVVSPTPEQIVTETWNAIIGGARGIEYFNHSFYPGKETEHLLIDPRYAATAAAISANNQRITQLAPVLNAPFAENFVAIQQGAVNVMAKAHNGSYYVFTAPRSKNPQSVQLRLNGLGNATAAVLDEGRSVPITNGVLFDSFASETDINIYRFDIPSTPGSTTTTTTPVSSTTTTTTVPTAPSTAGVVATPPTRILDTRLPVATASSFSPGVTRLNVKSSELLPADAQSALVNVVAVSPSGPGFLTAYSCDAERPTTSFLNYQRGDVRAASVRVPIAADGSICLYSLSKTDIVVDLTGYVSELAADSHLAPVTPSRIIDTRESTSLVQNVVREVDLSSLPQVTSETKALDLTVTAVGQKVGGWIQAYACGDTPPTTSTVNFAAGGIVPNSTIVAINTTRKLCLRSNVNTDVVVDLNGVYGPASSGVVTLPTTARRLIDTRSSTAIGTGRLIRVPVADSRAVAVEGTITAPHSFGPGFFTIYSCSTRRPLASNLNYVPGQIVANRFVVPVGTTGDICVYASNNAHVIIDLTQMYGATSS